MVPLGGLKPVTFLESLSDEGKTRSICESSPAGCVLRVTVGLMHAVLGAPSRDGCDILFCSFLI